MRVPAVGAKFQSAEILSDMASFVAVHYCFLQEACEYVQQGGIPVVTGFPLTMLIVTLIASGALLNLDCAGMIGGGDQELDLLAVGVLDVEGRCQEIAGGIV
jgi:hypothetical protein